MCGITGVIASTPVPKGIIELMTDALVHRGPDGFGYHYGTNFAFGHRRLSIVDLSEAGHQPMEYLGRYVITYNGEIYNHVELRDELIRHGYSFASQTDTEVILAAYDYWGTECLNRFNGMWAFVLYDREKQDFFISRDRFGKKPLYYYQDSVHFVFASEIKAILNHPDITTHPNVRFINAYLQNGCKEYLSETSFEGVFRFPPASFCRVKVDELMNGFIPHIFWKIHPNLSYESFNETKAHEYAKRYYDLLEDAVRIRLRADVKVGSALSGGLDSSSIVYLVNRLLREEGKTDLQETFSSVYKSTGTEYCDESYFINIMAQKLGVYSNQIEPVESDIPMEHSKMVYALENPPENTLMSSWYTFKAVAATDVRVTLDGQGADEQLAGYLPYLMNYISSLKFIDMCKESYRYISIPGARRFVFNGLKIGIFRLLFGRRLLLFVLAKILKKEFEPDLNRKLANDMQQSLATLIHYADHTSMAYSIESRMPFMDYRLVEFLASIPAVYKMHDGWTKYLARLAFDKKLPDEITWRRDKMGWPIPEKKWFNGSLQKWFSTRTNNNERIREFSLPIATNPEQTFAQKVRILNITVWKMKFFKDSKTI